MKDRLKSFFVKQKPFIALFMGFVLLAASVAIGLRADATPMPTQTLSGTITSSQTLSPSYVYIVNPDVAIASGATLTIPAGTIVKFQSGPITVRQGGSLRVTGTAASPVHFTSIKDDTVGGDTNGDGNATAPAMDDYQRAVATEDGDVNIVFAKFNYFARAVEGSRTTGSIVVTDSTFNNGHVAIAVGGPTVKLYRNTFGNLEPYSLDGAVQVSGIQDLTKVSLSGVDQNTFTGTAKFSRIIRIAQSILPAGKTWSPARSSGATVYFDYQTYSYGTTTVGENVPIIVGDYRALSVIDGGVLNIASGSLIKYARVNSSIYAVSNGKIYVTGTQDKPVKFTSVKDDIVGGDTNGDFSATQPQVGDYSNAIESNDGYTNIVYAEFSYFNTAIVASNPVNAAVITDSKFNDGRHAVNVRAPIVKFYRNTVNVMPNSLHDGAVKLTTTDLSKISLSGPDTNLFNGSAKFSKIVIIEASQLPSGKSWSVSSVSGATPFFYWNNEINGALTLGANSRAIVNHGDAMVVRGSLNVQSGVVIKQNEQSYIKLKDSAVVNVTGTQQNKVTFTSLKDDTVGGDTNGDGASTTAGTADYPYSLFAEWGTSNAKLNVAHANFRNSSLPIYGTFSLLNVKDSTFSQSYAAIQAHTSSIVMERNAINVMPQENSGSIYISGATDLSGLILSGSNKNIFTGSPRDRILTLESSIIPQDKTMTVTGDSGAILRFTSSANTINGSLVLDQNSQTVFESAYGAKVIINGSVDILKGAIIKAKGAEGFEVRESGKLNIVGEENNTVKITSLRDDTIGGDTNGDGPATQPSLEDGITIITGRGGDTILRHADIKYFAIAIRFNFNKFVMTDSSMTDLRSGIGLTSPSVVLERNFFSVQPVSSLNEAAVTLNGVSDLSSVILAGADRNIFAAGSDLSRTLSIDGYSSLPTGSTWNISNSSNVVIRFTSLTTINGTVNWDSNSKIVFSSSYQPNIKLNGIVNIAEGSILKSKDSEGFKVMAGGKLNINGLVGSPVIFTSLRDDTIGGDTNGDGSNTLPSNSDSSILASSESEGGVNINNTSIRYILSPFSLSGKTKMDAVSIRNASTAFSLLNGDANLTNITINDVAYMMYVDNAAVVFRGQVNNVTDTLINACDWSDMTCSVDASYTNWGNTDPFMKVCGKVTLLPAASSIPDANGLFASKNCNGSPTPNQQLNASTANFSSRVAQKNIDCNNGFQDACQAMQTAFTCLSGAVNVAASTTPFPLPDAEPHEAAITWGETAAENAYAMVSAVEKPSPYLTALDFNIQLLGVINTFSSLLQAYNSCAP